MRQFDQDQQLWVEEKPPDVCQWTEALVELRCRNRAEAEPKLRLRFVPLCVEPEGSSCVFRQQEKGQIITDPADIRERFPLLL